MFKVFIVILLTNICIALLNNTMNRIHKEKENVWKYTRTKVWMRLINERHIPPPFNIISLLTSAVGKYFKRQGGKNPNGSKCLEMRSSEETQEVA